MLSHDKETMQSILIQTFHDAALHKTHTHYAAGNLVLVISEIACVI